MITIVAIILGLILTFLAGAVCGMKCCEDTHADHKQHPLVRLDEDPKESAWIARRF